VHFCRHDKPCQIVALFLVEVTVGDELQQFRERLKVLFIDGVVFTPHMKSTFTAAGFKFLKKGKVIRWKDKSITIALPSRDDSEAWLEPLELVRAVVGKHG